MKRFFLLLALPAVMAATTRMNDELPIGSAIPAPEVKMKDIGGKSYSFNDVKKENGLLVVFSCNTCPWVIKNESVADAAYNYALSKGVGVIILNSNEAQRSGDDSEQRMQEYAQKLQFNWPYVIDEHSKMANLFGAKVTPECYLFDKNMKLVYHGAITDNPKNPESSTREHLKLAVDELSGKKEVSVKTSKAMGCTIKRKS